MPALYPLSRHFLDFLTAFGVEKITDERAKEAQGEAMDLAIRAFLDAFFEQLTVSLSEDQKADLESRVGALLFTTALPFNIALTELHELTGEDPVEWCYRFEKKSEHVDRER